MTKTYAQLSRQIESLQQQAEGLRRKEIADVVKRMKEAIEVYGLTAADLGLEGRRTGAKTAGGPVRKVAGRKKLAKSRSKPKFKDADGNVWSGRGPRPGWFKAALAVGKTPEELLA
ncbi:H-NS histone family protein [Methylibium sp.]|uniref:H-NS histone family protein n=1 Tax=Methylibium sp. TaxID=2067992 RepID=UPI00286B7666|nr:H-NS histone family protein [Methylibium sp.]